MVAQASYLIIGNGIAGVTAAEVLRTEDADARITVIADDPFPVYYRPALKDYLAGRVHEDKLWARPTSFYQDHAIHFLSERVVSIQAGQHTVQFQSGRELGYSRLLLASGARAASLTCPGLTLKGVSTLRTVADYQAVVERLNRVKRVVVSGSGTLALETIETLRHRGYVVTHLLRRRTLWSEVLDATASDLVLQQEKRDGVDVRLEEEIAEITGQHGQVNGVVTTKGERIACEMVLIAIGIEPIIDFIKKSGIGCGRGVKVDGNMRTNAPDIYAAGDVLETTDSRTGRTRVIGQWYPSVQQARVAAYSMLGMLNSKTPFTANTFYNATFLYGLDFASVGLTNAQGYQEVIAPPKPRSYRKVLLQNGVPVGILSLGDRKHALAFKRAIDHQVNLQSITQTLFADNFDLNGWLDQLGVPPPQLGIKRTDTVTDHVPAVELSNGKHGVAAPAPDELETIAATAVNTPASVATPASAQEVLFVPVPSANEAIKLTEVRLNPRATMIVGREAGVYLLIDHGTISRRHAEMSYQNGRYTLCDLGSSNGTFVNEVRLTPQKVYALKQGDTVRFGTSVTYTLQEKREPVKAKRPVSLAGMTGILETRIYSSAEVAAASSSQPMLNADGSLLLPGTSSPLPAAVVESFKKTPALVIISGGTKESSKQPLVFSLRQGKRLTIGRDKSSDIALADIVASRKHAEVSPGPDGFYIRDLGSSNGVIVNQTKIDNPYRLSHGDRATIGSSSLYYMDLTEASDERNAPPNKAEMGQPLVRSLPYRTGTERASGQLDAEQQATKLASAPLPAAQLIICPRCGTSNMPVARFCAGCSTPLR